MQISDEVKDHIRAELGKPEAECSDADLLGLIDVLHEHGRSLDCRDRSDRLIGDIRHIRRRRWQEECKANAAPIRELFLLGYDHAMACEPTEHRHIPHYMAGFNWGECIGKAYVDDETIDPGFLATIREGVCEAHVAASRFCWPGEEGNNPMPTFSPYYWIYQMMDELSGEETSQAA